MDSNDALGRDKIGAKLPSSLGGSSLGFARSAGTTVRHRTQQPVSLSRRGSSGVLSRGQTKPTLTSDDILWSEWSLTKLMDGREPDAAISILKNLQDDARNYMKKYHLRDEQAAPLEAAATTSTAEPSLGVPMSPRKFAKRQERLQALGFIPSSIDCAHQGFHGLATWLREDAFVELAHKLVGPRERECIMLAERIGAGWETFPKLAKTRVWGVEVDSEGRFVPGECFRRLAAVTVECLPILMPTLVSYIVSQFNSLCNIYAGLADAMPDLVNALVLECEGLDLELPQFGNCPPVSSTSDDEAQNTSFVASATAHHTPLQHSSGAICNGPKSPTSRARDSPTTPLFEAVENSENSSPNTLDAHVPDDEDEDYEDSDGMSVPSYWNTEEYNSYQLTCISYSSEDGSTRDSARSLHGYLDIVREEAREKWEGLMQVIEYEEEVRQSLPHTSEERRKMTDFGAERTDLAVWLRRFEIVLNNQLHFPNWPQDNLEDSNLVREFYGLPMLNAADPGAEEEKRKHLMRLHYHELFNDEFPAPQGIIPYPEEPKIESKQQPAPEKPSSWWRKAVKVVKQGAAAVVAGAKAACSAVARSVYAVCSLTG